MADFDHENGKMQLPCNMPGWWDWWPNHTWQNDAFESVVSKLKVEFKKKTVWVKPAICIWKAVLFIILLAGRIKILHVWFYREFIKQTAICLP